MNVQAYDANTAKTNVTQTFTQPQRPATYIDAHDSTFDLAASQNFYCQPASAVTLTFTTSSGNSAGQSGYILFNNNSNYAITKSATVRCEPATLSKLSTTGLYLVSYFEIGGYCYLTTSGALL